MKKIVALLFLLILIGCGKTPGSQKTFESIMNTFQSGNSNEIIKKTNEVFQDNPFDEYFFEQAPFYAESLKKIKYKVIEVKEEKEISTIKFSIEAPDLFNYAPDIFQRLFGLAFSGSSEEMLSETLSNDFSEILKKKDLKYTSKELILTMIKKDGKWIFDDEIPDFSMFTSILFGGLDKMGENGNFNNDDDEDEEVVETKFFKKGEKGVLTLTAQTLTDVKIKEPHGYYSSQMKDGHELIVITLLKENISDQLVNMTLPDEYQIETEDGLLIKPTIGSGYDNYNYDNIPAGNKIEQILVYQVPKGQAKNLILINKGVKFAVFDLGL